MLRTLIVLALAVVAAVTGGVAAATASPDPSLHVTLGRGRPHIEHALRYAAARPIVILVDGRRARGAVSVVGLSPEGENLRIPLARRPAGDYAGTLTFPTPGTWSLAIATQGAAVSTASFALAVAAEGSRGWIVACAAFAALCLAAGVVLIVYGMRRRSGGSPG